MKVDCIFFGVPEGFSTTHSEYYDLLFKHYQSGRKGTKFSVEVFGDKFLSTYVNYDFLSKSGRPGSMFGVCLAFQSGIPIDFQLQSEYFDHVFKSILNSEKFFSSIASGAGYKYKIDNIDKVDFSGLIEAIVNRVRESQILDNIVNFPPLSKAGVKSVIGLSYDESTIKILKELRDGKGVVFSEEYKPEKLRNDDKKSEEQKLIFDNQVAQFEIRIQELQNKFGRFHKELVWVVDRWGKDLPSGEVERPKNEMAIRQSPLVQSLTNKRDFGGGEDESGSRRESHQHTHLPQQQWLSYAVYAVAAIVVGAIIAVMFMRIK